MTLLDLFQQVGALGGVHDEPEFGAEVRSAAGAIQFGGLLEGVGYGLLPPVRLYLSGEGVFGADGNAIFYKV